jgi:hypothetical protein
MNEIIGPGDEYTLNQDTFSIQRQKSTELQKQWLILEISGLRCEVLSGLRLLSMRRL